MAITEDLIDFDIIETHKENIQSLPGGRSAKALAATYAPPSLLSTTPTPSDTRNLHDAIRQEYELEIIAISDSDDPLDIYDRYVKWTLTAYPSAQATAESQLRPLLERATKAFQTAAHYKNDPRYLKLWLTYIRLFSDAPRETFAYLARHNIGEGLALFYEEFAAWLEGAGRWTQADEVYRLGIEREARPTERLVRKYGEFQHRFERRAHDGDEPSSPALPTVRPALMAKLDPFALSTPRTADPQAQRLFSGAGGSSTSRGGKQKIAIFSDADAPVSGAHAVLSGTSKGWDNIGSIAERTKENVVEARAWTGETLKLGRRPGAAPKMMIFKDQPSPQIPAKQIESTSFSERQETRNSKTGKIERVFVNLEVIYPNPNNPNEEMSFEELRAESRGWTSRNWAAERSIHNDDASVSQGAEVNKNEQPPDLLVDCILDSDVENRSIITAATEVHVDVVLEEPSRVSKTGRTKKMKVMEVKAETQTVKTNLESPTGPKLKRKNSTEPTMTLHTKAATNAILDIFNQPLSSTGLVPSQAESAGESDFEDDDYTSAGESTGTGRISGPSEFGDDETDPHETAAQDQTETGTESQWSEFSVSKHVPQLDLGDIPNHANKGENIKYETDMENEDPAQTHSSIDDDVDLVTPILTESAEEIPRTKFIPLPPADYEPPNGPYRDPSQVVQNRLPFMTPIVEKTESSMGALTILKEKDYFNSRTPSKYQGNEIHTMMSRDGQLISPFREIVNEAKPQPIEGVSRGSSNLTENGNTSQIFKLVEPIIQDTQCNPTDEGLRKTILDNLNPPLSSYPSFFDYRPQFFNRGPEIRKHVKALSKNPKGGSDKTTAGLSLPPSLQFPSNGSGTYTVKRELGKGAFAPVYLVQQEMDDDNEQQQSAEISSRFYALKCEHPPSPWEFYIMSTLHKRIAEHPALQDRSSSLLAPHALHLFADEGYLLEQYLEQGTLLDLVNLAKPSPSGVLDETVAMFFTVELLRAVEAMHVVGILHGDLKADNCLVRLTPPSSTLSSSTNAATADMWDPEYQPNGEGGWASKGLCLIDFGRGIDLRQFRPEVQFIADWKTDKDDCAEMREMRPWTWQVDYWGLAGVAHNLLFGKFIEDVAVDDARSPSESRGKPSTADLIDDDDAAADATTPVQPEPERSHAAPATTTATPNATTTIATTPGGTLAGRKKWKLREPLKRYWQTQLWAPLFDLLLNPVAHAAAHEPSGTLPVTASLGKCRQDMEAWLQRESGRRGLKASLRRLEERILKERGGKGGRG